MKDAIPKQFYRGGRHPVVTSVGELKAQLAQLPDDLPIKSGFADAAELVVYNINDDPFLEIVEPDDE